MDVLTYFEKLNWQTIIAMCLIGWYFTHDIRKSLENLDNDVKKQGARTDKLYEMFCELQKQMKEELLDLKKDHYEFINNQRK
jgi:hypothetical protein